MHVECRVSAVGLAGDLLASTVALPGQTLKDFQMKLAREMSPPVPPDALRLLLSDGKILEAWSRPILELLPEEDAPAHGAEVDVAEARTQPSSSPGLTSAGAP